MDSPGSNPDLIVIITSPSPGKWLELERNESTSEKSLRSLIWGVSGMERKEGRERGKAGITVWAGGIWSLSPAHLNSDLRTQPCPPNPPLDQCRERLAAAPL